MARSALSSSVGDADRVYDVQGQGGMMGGQTLEWEDCAPEIRKVARKYEGYRALGFDQDDLEQEAAIVALRCMEQFKAGRVVSNRQAFLRTALRNEMVKLRDRAYADCRTLKDCWGHSKHPLSFDSLEQMVECETTDLPQWYVNAGLPLVPSPEKRVEARDLVAHLRAELPAEDWQLLIDAFIDGAHEARALRRWKPRGKLRRETQQRLGLAVASATAILSRACYPVERGLEGMDFLGTLHSKIDPSRIPPCHPEGTDPLGYDKDDSSCHNCPDKFRCLPLSLELKLIGGDLGDDTEVRAVVNAGEDFTAAQRAHSRALERMKRRLALTKSAHLKGVPPLIPLDLLTRGISKTSPPLTREAFEDGIAKGKELGAQPSPDPVLPPKLAKRKRPKRPKKKPKPKAPKEGERGTMKNGKPLPPVRQLTPDAMLHALERVKIAQPFPLELGMRVVRKKRGGDLVVFLRETGFEWDGTLYSSLSTAAMYAERRVVSANAFFNLKRNKCTEIRDSNGRAIAGHDARHGDARYKP